MRRRMRREDRRVVAGLGFLHGTVHANILSIPLFLLAWHVEFGADNLTLGLLAAAAYSLYGIGAVPFGFLADRRAPDRLLLLCASGIAGSMAAVAASPSVPILAVSLGALGLFSGAYHPTGLSVISRTVTEQGRGIGSGFFAAALGLGAVGQVFSGTLADRPRPDRPLFALSATAAGSLAARGYYSSRGWARPSSGSPRWRSGLGSCCSPWKRCKT